MKGEASKVILGSYRLSLTYSSVAENQYFSCGRYISWLLCGGLCRAVQISHPTLKVWWPSTASLPAPQAAERANTLRLAAYI